MRHLGQVGHHGRANDVLAQPHGQLRSSDVVNLRAQDFRQTNGLPFGVRQLQRHGGFAGYGLHHPNADQAQAARQVFGQVHHLRTFDTRGRFDFVTRDHRTRRGGDDTHLHAKVFEFFLDQTRGHLQCFGGDGFNAHTWRGIEQIDLRQLGVGQLGEEWLLFFFRHPRAFRYFDQRCFNQDGFVGFLQPVFHLGHHLALALRLFAKLNVLRHLQTFLTAFAHCIEFASQPLRRGQP